MPKRFTLGECLDQLRFYLNEEEEPEEGTNSLYTSDKVIVNCIRRSCLTLITNNPESLDTNFNEVDDGVENILALHFGDLTAELPIKAQYIPMVEDNAFKLLQIRDQQGVRPEVAAILERMFTPAK